MASIPGAQFNITGASGSVGSLSPRSGYFCYVFPRGGWAAQDSTGTVITFDTAAIASRFAALDWIQVGTATANIRRVSAVGGNSLSVQGSAVTVSEDTRVFLIGATQPSTSGGSATYTIPATVIRHRDDDSSDRFTNSMVTSNSDGLIAFYGPHGIYDVLVQDGNQSAQGYIADLSVGMTEGVSTALASVFGATVTINAALGITGWATFGQTATFNGAAGFTGWATFGASVTMNANAGVTGTFAIGGTATITGRASFGNSVSIDGVLGMTGAVILGVSGIVGGLSVSTGIFGVSNQPRTWLVHSPSQDVTSGTALRLLWSTEHFDVGDLHSGSSSSINITNPGFYLFIGQVEWNATVGATGTNTPYTATIRKNNSGTFEVAEVIDFLGSTNVVLKQSLSGMDMAIAGDYYDLTVTQVSGTTQSVSCTTGRLNSQFSAVKLF